jgi:flagellin
MTTINTNYSALVVHNDLAVNNRTLGSAMEQLSTGKRINSAIDDASGVSLGNSRSRQIQGLNQAMRNANDGISMMQTADGALSEVNNILNRMRELAIQAGNDTNTGQDRYALDQEYQQLNREVSRVATNTQWNGMNVLNTTEVGVAGTSSDVSNGQRNVRFHVGANSNQVINVGLKDFSYNLGVAAKTQETKLTLGDMRDKQYFQFSIAKDVINNGTTGTQTVSFDLSRPIAAATMTEDELVDFETQMTRAITDATGYSNVSVTRVANDIYVKDAEGRSIAVTALTGGSTAATRGTTTGFTVGNTYPSYYYSSHTGGTSPNTYTYYIDHFTNTKTTFSIGDIKGKQNLNVSMNGRNFSFDLANRIAGSVITTGEGSEMEDLVNKLRASITAQGVSSTYTVSTTGTSFSVNYSYADQQWAYSGASITGGSTSETRSTTIGYAGSTVSSGQTATVAATPTSTAVFSGTARLNDTRISTQEDANVAVGRIDSAMLLVDAEQTKFGSVMNRLERAGDTVMRAAQSTSFSRSRLFDTDYAATTTEVVRKQIIQQAGMAMLTQANQLPNSVLTLLK